MAGQYSKSVDTVVQNVDYLISMGCGDSCPNVIAKDRIDWDIPDPKDMNDKEFKEVIALIDKQVQNLIKNII
jgi:protein-tyrosine-phosphatase